MVFTETNQYSKNLAHNIVRKKLQNKERSNEVNLGDRQKHKMQIMLPYGGTNGSKLMTKTKKQKKSLLNNIKRLETYPRKNLSSKFLVKNKTNFFTKVISFIMVNAPMKIVGTII